MTNPINSADETKASGLPFGNASAASGLGEIPRAGGTGRVFDRDGVGVVPPTEDGAGESAEVDCGCEQYRNPPQDNPNDPGRAYELCMGQSFSDRPVTHKASANWRAANNLAPLPPRTNAATPVADHGKPREPKPPRTPQPKGVGAHLKEILASLGITIPGCEGCTGTMSRMNSLGPEGCRTHMDSFVNELRGRAKGVPMSQWAMAAGNAVLNGLAFRLNPLDPFAGLIEEAIRRTEQAP